jgi:hypothetical protein
VGAEWCRVKRASVSRVIAELVESGSAGAHLRLREREISAEDLYPLKPFK